MNLEQICFSSIDVVKKAGHFIKNESKKWESSQLEFKGKNDIVTYVDKAAEHILVNGLKDILPDAAFYTEEHTVSFEDKEFKWVIDPLDGTTNYVYNLPIYSVSVALRHHRETILGIVYEINNDECFYSWRGEKAFLNGNVINVSDTDKLSDSMMATGIPNAGFELIGEYLYCLRDLMDNIRGIRRLGSAAVDLAYLACGRFDIYFENGLSPWDVAAGGFLVEQAGGKVSCFGSTADYVNSREIVAANPYVYDDFIAIIHKHFKENDIIR